jgi:zinc transport system permease protein
MTGPMLFLGVSRDAFCAVALASALSGLVGTVVVLRRLVSLGGGIAHAAFGGVGLALVAGIDPRFGGAVVAVAAAAALSPLGRERILRQDAVVGVLWAIGMAVGMILVSGAGGDHDVEELLFGELTAVRAADLWLLGGMVAVVIAAFALVGRGLAATAFDEEHARLRGLPVGWLSFALLLLVALSVVALLTLVGVVLAIAMLAIPPLVALRLFRSLPAIVAGGTGIALLMSVSGLAVASRYAIPAGPAIILAGGLLLGLAQAVPRRTVR